MASVIVAGVDQIRSLLQTQADANGFIHQFTAEQSYRPDVALTDDELHVQLVHDATGIRVENGVRGKLQYRFPVRIGIRKRFEVEQIDPEQGFAASDEVHKLVELTEQICEYLYQKTWATGQTVGPGSILNVAPDNKFAEEQSFFAIVVVEILHFKQP